MVEHITCMPIGPIHSPFAEVAGMPVQPSGGLGGPGELVLLWDYVPGLKDLDGFSHIILLIFLYHFHRSKGASLPGEPFLDTVPRGVFATRAPAGPDPTACRLPD